MGPISPYTYDRLDTIEYVIEAIPPSGSGLQTAWIGSDGAGGFTNYLSLAEAQQSPFQYTFPIADIIEITRFIRTNTLNPLKPTATTPGIDCEIQHPLHHNRYPTICGCHAPLSVAQTNEQNYITLTNPPGLNRFFAVQPLWP
jgi:hypothetical protein